MKHQNIAAVLGRPPVHPFPARMAPDLAIRVLRRLREGARVLDPMSGSGTVLALAQAHGYQSTGLDVDPLAVLMARVWTRPVSHAVVRKAGAAALRVSRRSFKSASVASAYPSRADDETKAFVRFWFDSYARRQLSCLSRAIASVQQVAVRDVLWCAFSRLIIAKQAGASLAMDLSHSRPHRAYTRAPRKPFREFELAVERVLAGCPMRSGHRAPSVRVRLGDARRIQVEPGSIDLVFTSPPYLNAIDYLRCSKFSLVWMGHSVASLREIRSESIGSYAAGSCSPKLLELVERECDWERLSARAQGVVRRYVADTQRSLMSVKRALASGGRAVYVVGENTVEDVFIPTGSIVRSIAKSIGLRALRGRVRELPASRRYMPPPTGRDGDMDGRMNQEVIVNLRKI